MKEFIRILDLYDKINKEKAGGSNQNERLLRRGNAISGAPINNGTIQLPKPFIYLL